MTTSCGYQRSRLTVCDVVQAYSEVSGGVKRYVHDKMHYAAQRDDIGHVLIVPGEGNTRRAERGSRVYEVASPPIPGSKGYRFLWDAGRIRDIIHAESPDVIEVGNAYWPAWVSIKAAKSERIPVVGFYHSDFPRALGDKLGDILKTIAVDEMITDTIEAYLVNLYNKMAATVTATRHFKDLLEAMGVQNVVHIPLGADTDIFHPTESRADVLTELGLSENVFLIFYAGRFAGMKNIPEMIAMMDHLQEAPRPAHLVLMGDGDYAEMVEEAQRGRNDVTRRAYCANPSELARWYAAADLFLNPGTHETFGLVAVEAQACGTRVLGVRGGGMDEVLEGEQPLIMADSEAPTDLSRAVKAVIDLDEGTVEKHARRRRMVERFAITKNFDTLFRLYRRLASPA